MPTLSDRPYPFNYLPKGLVSTFEHYQKVHMQGVRILRNEAYIWYVAMI